MLIRVGRGKSERAEEGGPERGCGAEFAEEGIGLGDAGEIVARQQGQYLKQELWTVLAVYSDGNKGLGPTIRQGDEQRWVPGFIWSCRHHAAARPGIWPIV